MDLDRTSSQGGTLSARTTSTAGWGQNCLEPRQGRGRTRREHTLGASQLLKDHSCGRRRQGQRRCGEILFIVRQMRHLSSCWIQGQTQGQKLQGEKEGRWVWLDSRALTQHTQEVKTEDKIINRMRFTKANIPRPVDWESSCGLKSHYTIPQKKQDSAPSKKPSSVDVKTCCSTDHTVALIFFSLKKIWLPLFNMCMCLPAYMCVHYVCA